MQFTDSHCHLDFTELSSQLPQLLQDCQDNNIHRIIVPAVNPEHWQRVLSLSTAHHKVQTNHSQEIANQVDIACCLGIHPWFLIIQDKLSPKNLDLAFHQQQLTKLVHENREKIIAVGECGIDVFKAKKNTDNEQALAENIKLQQDFFAMQLQLAKASDLPVVVHHCQSHQYLQPMLKQYNLSRAGVIHAFSGSYQQAKAYVDLGFKIGIGGTITYPRAKKTINAIKRLPLDCLLLETDAPAMPPSGQQGLINTPLNIPRIFQALTEIRSESVETIATQIERNVEQVFY